jgi:hypothetical protein
MISLLTIILPLIMMNTPPSYVSTAFLALLLSVNVLMQVHLVLGERATGTAAFIPLHPLQRQEISSKTLDTLRSHPWQVAFTESSRLTSLESTPPCPANEWNRRAWLSSVASLTLIADKANAENMTSTDAVDWNSFGASLRESTPGHQSAPLFVGGSDLEKALQNSANRKRIDPRTHG